MRTPQVTAHVSSRFNSDMFRHCHRHRHGCCLSGGLVCSAARELEEKESHKDPSAALVKAALVNGCDPLTYSDMPNYESGFGRVNLAQSEIDWHDSETSGILEKDLPFGEDCNQVLKIQYSGELRVTLVWTDPPGELLQNHLDLIVQIRSTSGRTEPHPVEYHGNLGNATAFDRVNTVEKVSCRVKAEQQAAIRVHAHEYLNPTEPQRFALVWRILKP